MFVLASHRLCRFGFNNGKTMVDGLDGENTISHTWQSGDFATIVYQLRLLGFNTVRLPFLFNDLLARTPQVWQAHSGSMQAPAMQHSTWQRSGLQLPSGDARATK